MLSCLPTLLYRTLKMFQKKYMNDNQENIAKVAKLRCRCRQYILPVFIISLGMLLMSSQFTLLHVEGSTSGECDSGWASHRNYCFALFNVQTDWFRAFNSCQLNGADLVVIRDAVDNSFITTQVPKETWISATDHIHENIWMWKIGTIYSNISYTNWNTETNEPNDAGGEDCGTIWWTGKWNDQNCLDMYPFICYKGPTMIKQFPQNITVKENGTLHITAIVNTKQSINYTWTRQGELLKINSNDRFFSSEASASSTETKISLIVLNVQPSDRGLWEFSIMPYNTTFKRSCIVKVLEDPKLKVSVASVSLFGGSKLELTCFMTNAENVDLFSVSGWLWIKDNKNVSNNVYTVVNMKTYNSSNTTITKVSIGGKDSGTYCCKLSGYTFQTEACAEVKVYKLSPVLQGSNEFTNLIEGSKLKLTCSLSIVGGIDLSTLPNWLWIKDNRNVSTIEFKIANTKTYNSSNTTISKSGIAVKDTGRYCCDIFGNTLLNKTCAEVKVHELSPDGIMCLNDTDQYGIKWPSIPAGNVIQNSCAEGRTGTTKRECNKEGQWMTTDTSQCNNPVYDNVIQELKKLTDNTTLEVVESTINNSIQILLTTTDASVIVAGEINQIMTILDSVISVAASYNASVDDQNVFEIIDGLVSQENEDSWKILGNTETDGTSNISQVLTLVDSTVALLFNNGISQNFSGENFVISIDKSTPGSDIVFPKIKKDKSYLFLKSQENTNETGTEYAGALFKTISGLLGELTAESNMFLYSTGSNDSIIVNSEVLSLKLKNAPAILWSPLSLNFPYVNKMDGTTAKCVFWNVTLENGGGGWSTDGCTVRQSENGLTTCECNHLTNFAVLMQPYETNEETALALELISIIGCSTSIFFATLTVLVYAIVWKAIQNDVHLLIICLCLSIIFSFSLFLFGGENTDNEVICKLLTASLHYFLLVMFFVMLCIGLHYFVNVTVMAYSLSLGSTLSAKINTKVLLIIIWGLPIVIAGITLGSYWNHEYHLINYCWLSISSGSLYTFIVPVLIIIIVNILIIISLIRVLMSVAIVKDNDLKSKVVVGIRSLGTQLPVLGVTWLFGILAVNEEAQVFQYLFAIFNSLQGLFIFLFHVVLNLKVREGWKKRFFSMQSSVSSTKMTTLTSNTISEASEPMAPDIKRKIISSAAAEKEPKPERQDEKKRDTILEITSNWKSTPKIIHDKDDTITEET